MPLRTLALAAALILAGAGQSHGQQPKPTKYIAIDGDSMAISPHHGTKSLATVLQKAIGSTWLVTNFAVVGSDITGFTSVTGRETQVNATYSTKNTRNELIIWIGTNDGCIESDTFDVAASEAQTYLQQMKAAPHTWSITWIAMLPRNA